MDGPLKPRKYDITYTIYERSRFPRNMTCSRKEGEDTCICAN